MYRIVLAEDSSQSSKVCMVVLYGQDSERLYLTVTGGAAMGASAGKIVRSVN